MSRVIRPVEEIADGEPRIFVGGCIRGADDWQSVAIDIIQREGTGAYIVCPRADILSPIGSDHYDIQVAWARRQIEAADVVMLWFARQRYPVEGKLYAEGSLEEFRQYHSRAVVGVESGFYHEPWLRDFAENAGVPVYDSLEATIGAALGKLT